MNRKNYYWKLSDRDLQLGPKTLLMGVLNITPDSFSDGGKFNDPDRAYARALQLEDDGADIIDIGAESTRPGSKRISADEEWQRLVPVLKKLGGALKTPISLDTYKSETARRALEHGVAIINDPSGLTFDPAVARVAAEGNAGLILNHMRGQPETWAKLPPIPDVVNTICKELEATINRARRAGVEKSRIVADPGLGFGKRKEQNSEIVAKLSRLATLDCPILTGPSRKSFLALESDEDTIFATAAAVTASILNGAHIVRVHDVKQMKAVVLTADEMVRAQREEEPADEKPEKVFPVRSERGSREWEEKRRPMRAPLARPVRKEEPVEEQVEAASLETGEDAQVSASEPVELASAEAAPVAEAKPEFGEPRAEREGGWRPPKKREFEGERPARRDDKREDKRSGGGFRKFSDRGGERGERPRYDRPRADRPGADRPRADRSRGDRPPGDRPRFDRPRRDGDRPAFDRPRSDRPRSDRPRRDDERPRRDSGDRPRYDRPRFDRPSQDRPGGGRPRGDRPPSGRGPRDESGSKRPPFRKDGPPRRFEDRPRRFEGKAGGKSAGRDDRSDNRSDDRRKGPPSRGLKRKRP